MMPEDTRDTPGCTAEQSSEMDGGAAARLSGLTEKEAAAQLQTTMTQLMGELHRMENNLQAMLHLSDENVTEGGTEHGSD